MQVLSLTSPGLHNLEPAESISLVRRTDDLIAATISSYQVFHVGVGDSFVAIQGTEDLQATELCEPPHPNSVATLLERDHCVSRIPGKTLLSWGTRGAAATETRTAEATFSTLA